MDRLSKEINRLEDKASGLARHLHQLSKNGIRVLHLEAELEITTQKLLKAKEEREQKRLDSKAEGIFIET